MSKNNKVYQLINKLRKVRRINEAAASSSTICNGIDNAADYSYAEEDNNDDDDDNEEEEDRKRDEFDFDQAYEDDLTAAAAATEEENDAQAAALAQRDDAWDAFTLTPEEKARLLTVQSHILWLKPGKVPARYSFIKTVSAKTTPQYLTTLVFLIHAFLEESESRWPQKCPVVVFGSAEPLTALERSKSLRARLAKSRAVIIYSNKQNISHFASEVSCSTTTKT